MNRIKAGVGGAGTEMTMESQPHPPSHFEMHRMDVEKADDGSFVMKHRMRLKKKHEGKDGFHHGYMDDKVHTAANTKELMAHMQKHFGAKMAPAGSSDAAEEAAEGE